MYIVLTSLFNLIALSRDAPVYIEQKSKMPSNTGLKWEWHYTYFKSKWIMMFNKWHIFIQWHMFIQRPSITERTSSKICNCNAATYQSSPTLKTPKLLVKFCMFCGLILWRKSMYSSEWKRHISCAEALYGRYTWKYILLSMHQLQFWRKMWEYNALWTNNHQEITSWILRLYN